MYRIVLSSIMFCLLFGCIALGDAAEISTYLAGEITEHAFAVGPEGAVWICLGNPSRLLRIDGDSVEQMPIEGSATLNGDWGADVYFNPSGQMLLLEQGVADGYNCDRFLYYYSEDEGLSFSGVFLPSATTCDGLLFDVQSSAYAILSYGEPCRTSSDIFELTAPHPMCRYRSTNGPINSALIITKVEAWIGVNGGGVELANLGTHQVARELGAGDGLSETGSYPVTRDGLGSLWLISDGQIVTYSGSGVEVYAPGDSYRRLVLSDEETVWAASDTFLARFTPDRMETFTVADGLLNMDIRQMLIDLDGNIWLRHPNGLTKIDAGDLPPQRLTVFETKVPDRIDASARLSNSGPAMDVDIYLAMELNGKILFWPFWDEAMYHYPASLLQGFSFSAVILEATDGLVTPGRYTFFSALAVRDSMRFIGGISTYEITVK
ncbi:MAG: hypothetical protein JW941_01370 [Candidatus Coatesbacteria bacterium]|nr:hypothetical protein [Candidatus Coatesbacteria bacterium]